MATDIHKKTMVSFLVPTPILETIEDKRSFKGMHPVAVLSVVW